VLIEQSAQSNRWRQVAPGAKASFALGGLIAAYGAVSPGASAAVAVLLALVTVFGAGVPFGRYCRVATPALLFLLISTFSLAWQLDLGKSGIALSLQSAPAALEKIAVVISRSLGALAALLFLVLTTPLPDLIVLLRRLRVPETLLELMVLCYRMLFVLSEAVHDTHTAQAARLGYASPRLALRSLGGLAACLTLQVWQRAQDLHLAAQARNHHGPLRFLETEFPQGHRDLVFALAAAGGLILLARLLP
jgi:cobalt/nickel transport system permease protein